MVAISYKETSPYYFYRHKRRSLSRQVSPSNSQFSRLQSSHRRPTRLPAASTTPRPATAASPPAPDSLDGDALQSAIVAPLTFPAQAHRDGSRLQHARAVGCGLGASEAGVGRPDERHKLAAAPRPLLGALSSRLQARPGAETSRGCSIETPGAAVWRPDSPYRAAAFRVFSAASSSARLGAPEASGPTIGSSSLRPPVLGELST